MYWLRADTADIRVYKLNQNHNSHDNRELLEW